MQDGSFQKHPLMKMTLGFTLVFLTGLWITNAAMYCSKMGFTSESVIQYYRGSEENFIPARSSASMMEVTHMHLPMMALVILMLTHLMIFAPFSERAKKAFIIIPFLAGLGNESSGWLVRFAHPGFAYLKIASFLILQASLGFLIAALAWFLISSGRRRVQKSDKGV